MGQKIEFKGSGALSAAPASGFAASETTNSDKVHIQTIELPQGAVLKKEMTEWAVVKALAMYGSLPMAANKERTQIVTVADYIEAATSPSMIRDTYARACLQSLLMEEKGVRDEAVITDNIAQLLHFEKTQRQTKFLKLMAFKIEFISGITDKIHEDDPMPAYERYVLSAMDYFHWMLQVTAAEYFTQLGGTVPPEMTQLEENFLQSITSNSIFNYPHLYELYNHINN